MVLSKQIKIQHQLKIICQLFCLIGIGLFSTLTLAYFPPGKLVITNSSQDYVAMPFIFPAGPPFSINPGASATRTYTYDIELLVAPSAQNDTNINGIYLEDEPHGKDRQFTILGLPNTLYPTYENRSFIVPCSTETTCNFSINITDTLIEFEDAQGSIIDRATLVKSSNQTMLYRR